MRLLLVALVLVGCSADAQKPPRTAKDRKEAAELQLAKTPIPRTYRYADGELKVLDVPVADTSGFVDRQRCFLWRDTEFKTATLSCGQQPEVLLAD